MFDSEGAWFLIVIFVLWVLESIAKARQRSRLPEEAGEEGSTASAPTTLEAPSDTRTGAERKPRNLWEEIAEIARQQQEQQRQRQQQLPPPDLPRREAPPPRRRPDRAYAPVPHQRPTSSRWQSAAEEEGTRRAEPEETPAADERRSDRWMAGRAEEGASAEGVATYDSEEARPRTFDVTPRPRREPVAPEAARAARGPQAVSLVPTRARKIPRAAAPGAAGARGPGSAAGGLGIDAHSLRGASRAELRRVLILREVLGPPVALREGPPAEE